MAGDRAVVRVLAGLDLELGDVGVAVGDQLRAAELLAARVLDAEVVGDRRRVGEVRGQRARGGLELLLLVGEAAVGTAATSTESVVGLASSVELALVVSSSPPQAASANGARASRAKVSEIRFIGAGG